MNPAPVQEMLEVVQHQQERFLAQIVQQLLLGVTQLKKFEVQSFGDGGKDQRRRIKWLEGDEVNPVSMQ